MNTEKNHAQRSMGTTFLAGLLLGALVFVAIYGTDVINVTNVGWLLNSNRTEGLWDLTQHYLGWVYYRNSPWHFPLGLLDGLYAEPISIVYTDSIPLFALLFKCLSPLLPEQFQYFGLFGLLCYGLMGGFVSLITYKYNKSLPVNLLCAGFFVLSPALLKRMFYHTALSAHFLIPASFCLWLYRDSFRRRRTYVALWSVTVTVSALINPYLTPMTLGILLCSLLQELIAAPSSACVFKKILPAAVIPCCCMAFFAYITGIFHGNVSAAAGGLEELSFNALQLVNPANYLLNIKDYAYLWKTQNYSLFLPALPSASPWQEEGFSYLGLGMLLLLLALAACWISRTLRTAHRRKHFALPQNESPTVGRRTHFSRTTASYVISLCVCAAVFTFLALSPRATLGTRELYRIPYPQVIFNLLSVFRSTGRLVWPVYYGIMALGLIGMVRLFSASHTAVSRTSQKSVSLCLLLLLLLAVQVLDLSPALAYKHRAYTEDITEDAYPFTDDAWDALCSQSKNVIFYTPTHYGLYCNPKFSCLFEKLGLNYQLKFNITYMSRDLSQQADAATLAHFEERKNGARFPENLYVFFDISEIPPAAETGLNYYEIDGFIVGCEQTLALSVYR